MIPQIPSLHMPAFNQSDGTSTSPPFRSRLYYGYLLLWKAYNSP